MDKVKKYQKIISEALREYYHRYDNSNFPYTRQVVEDFKNNHFQFLWVGWHERKYIFSADIHIDIIDQKVWIQKDITEIGFANVLVDKGIPKSDIVLAYFPPAHRELTEFAVA